MVKKAAKARMQTLKIGIYKCKIMQLTTEDTEEYIDNKRKKTVFSVHSFIHKSEVNYLYNDIERTRRNI